MWAEAISFTQWNSLTLYFAFHDQVFIFLILSEMSICIFGHIRRRRHQKYLKDTHQYMIQVEILSIRYPIFLFQKIFCFVFQKISCFVVVYCFVHLSASYLKFNFKYTILIFTRFQLELKLKIRFVIALVIKTSQALLYVAIFQY